MTRISVWILGDQLLRDHPALRYAETFTARDNVRVVLIESRARTSKLPYQRKKIVLLFSAMRHYADRLRAVGYEVDYIRSESFLAGLKLHIDEDQPEQLITMAASEYGTRALQNDTLQEEFNLAVTVLPNTQFLVEQFSPFANPDLDTHYVMDNFYRAMRQHFDVLMDGREPSGGAWNFDKLNRKPLPKNVQPPVPLTFEPDAITREVIYQVRGIKRAVGQLDDFHFAVTHEHAQAALLDFIEHRLPDFGPYEDAMSSKHDTLYHSVLSPYVNIGLLEPMEMIRAAEAAYREGRAPVHSVEGFVRQVLGWREYMYWQYWRQMPALYEANRWNATRSMPQMFWDANTDMNCIRCVTERVIKTGYSHHIERLMVICNFCLMAGVNPAQVADWFLIFYADAYEWVVLPNVIGMGLNADAGQTATKPYIASANYINKMSDYCKGCRYDPKKRTGENACPFNTLYWNFLLQNEAALRVNARMRTNLLGLSRLDDGERHVIQAEAAAFLESLHDYTD